MSAQDWSPEPWGIEFDEGFDQWTITWARRPDMPDFVTPVVCDLDATGKSEWDAKRIVACVNAMAGISDPAALVDAFEKLLDFAKVAAAEPGANAKLLACAEMVIARAEAARK